MAKLNSYEHHGSHQHLPCSKQTPELHFRKKEDKQIIKMKFESHFTIHSIPSLLSHNSHKQLQATTASQHNSRPLAAHHFDRICCIDDRICLLLHRRLLHFTSIKFAPLVVTNKTREAIVIIGIIL